MKRNFSAGSGRGLKAHDASSFHLTTMDFGKMICSYIYPVLSDSKVNLDMSQFFRLDALAVPTFGSARLQTHAFFVPYRLLTPNWNHWYMDTKDSSVSKELPTFLQHSIISSFINKGALGYALAERVESGDTISLADNIPSDFVLLDSSGTTFIGYRFTDRGRFIYSLLQSLGYNFNFVRSSYAPTGQLSVTENVRFSALPLLAFVRVLYDYLYPSFYVQQQGIEKYFNVGIYGYQDLQELYEFIFCAYQSDFYTSLWSQFNSPALNYQNDVVKKDTVIDSLGLQSSSKGTVLVSDMRDAVMNLLPTLSNTALSWLTSVSDYLTRNNLAGGRFLDRLVARQGGYTQVQAHDFSSHIKSWSSDIQLSPVSATTSTDTQMLGEQGATGQTQGSGRVRFDVKEDGFIICVSALIPVIGYYQGRKPWTLAVTYGDRLDYPTYDFDGTQMSPVRNDEIFAQYNFLDQADLNNSISDAVSNFEYFLDHGGKPDGVFGFAPIYHQWKHGYDFVSGDFSLKTRNLGRDSFHTFRVFNQPDVDNSDSIVLDANFLECDGRQYDRIFAVDPVAEARGRQYHYDHFNGYFNSKVTIYNKLLPLSSSFPMFDKSGEQVTSSQS